MRMRLLERDHQKALRLVTEFQGLLEPFPVAGAERHSLSLSLEGIVPQGIAARQRSRLVFTCTSMSSRDDNETALVEGEVRRR
jgi:hypothetical protein